HSIARNAFGISRRALQSTVFHCRQSVRRLTENKNPVASIVRQDSRERRVSRLRGKPCDHGESSTNVRTGRVLHRRRSQSDSLDTGPISSRSFERAHLPAHCPFPEQVNNPCTP